MIFSAYYQPDHAYTFSPWGEQGIWFTWPLIKVKRIDIAPGHALSLQYHTRRAEHWLCTRGRGVWRIGAHDVRVSQGARAFIPAGTVHRIQNDGDAVMTVLEIQTGLRNSECDIVRLADRYGR